MPKSVRVGKNLKIIIMNRFKIIEESKFEKLDHSEMGSIQGGLCISCKKRARKIELGLGASVTNGTNVPKEQEKQVMDSLRSKNN